MPQEIGVPARRKRRLSAGLNQQTLVWIGPATHDEMALEFTGLVAHSVNLEADDFLIDSPENRIPVLREFAKQRGRYVDDSTLMTLPWEALLPPGQLANLQKYRRMYKTQREKVGARGSFVVDISQDPDERARCGPWFPTIARGSILISLSSVAGETVFTNREIDFAMGFPAFRFPSNAHLVALSPKVEELDRAAYMKLMGNAIHMTPLMLFWAYIFRNTVRRNVLEGWQPELQWKPGVAMMGDGDGDIVTEDRDGEGSGNADAGDTSTDTHS